MACKPSLFILSLILLLGSCTMALAEVPSGISLPDSARLDTIQIIDTAKAIVTDTLRLDTVVAALVDTLKEMPVILPKETGIEPYNRSFLAGKGLGDYLWFVPGALPLQHGAESQPELLVKSILLGGLDVTYNRLPVFQQGFYIPYRSGADLNTMMFENISEIKLTNMAYLDLFSQGEVLSLKSMIWPSESNPSSVTTSNGPYSYRRSAWRFSRNLNENLAGSFIVGFKKSSSYYESGADYNGYSVSGSMAGKPNKASEIDYTFYLNKANQGVLQFDRLIPSNLRLNRSINYHTITGKYQMTSTQQIEVETYYQKNYSHAFASDNTYQSHISDYIAGAQGKYYFSAEKHDLTLGGGVQRLDIGGLGTDKAKLLTIGVMARDSIIMDDKQNLILSARVRHKSIRGFGFSTTGAYSRNLTEQMRINFSAGVLDYIPDLYSMFYTHTPILNDFIGSIQINSYAYRANPDINLKHSIFGQAGIQKTLAKDIDFSSGLTIEKVTNELMQVTIDSNATWYSKPINIDYKRISMVSQLDYSISKFYQGTSGFTLAAYSPQEPIAGYKHSPILTAFSNGQFIIKEVLRDIDLSSVYQIRFISRRDYAGFIKKSYKPAIVLDGHLGVRFGAVTFRLIGTNLLDFIGANTYEIWGDYDMPPGSIWWLLTWDMSN